jgi:hypothetical protein
MYYNSISGLESSIAGIIAGTVYGVLRFFALNTLSTIMQIVDDIEACWDIGFGPLFSMISIPMNIAFLCLFVAQATSLDVSFPWAS